MTQRCETHLPIHRYYLHAFQGVLIPVGEDIKAFTVDEDVDAVLVVEKDVRPPVHNDAPS